MNVFTNRLPALAIIQASTFAWINTHTKMFCFVLFFIIISNVLVLSSPPKNYSEK